MELFGRGNAISIGCNTKINGAILVAHNGTRISIGQGCLFSTLIDIRTTDSHKIYDADDHQINPDADVFIADRVWLAKGCYVLKGSRIGNGAVIGANSLVSGEILPNAIAAGSPAKVIKERIRWEF